MVQIQAFTNKFNSTDGNGKKHCRNRKKILLTHITTQALTSGLFVRKIVWFTLNFNSLPTYKSYDLPKLKAFADNKSNVTQTWNLFWKE